MTRRRQAGSVCVTRISSAEATPVQEWNDWKPAPVYTQLYFSFYLFRLFSASLSVNELKMLLLYCVAFVSFALSALILNASLVVLTSPPQSMSSWNFILVEFLLEMILVWGTTPITALSLTLHGHFSIHYCLTLLLQVAFATCQNPLSYLSHSD